MKKFLVLTLLLALGFTQQPKPGPKTLPQLVSELQDGESLVLPDGVVTLDAPLRLVARRGVTIKGGKGTLLNYVGPDVPKGGVVDLLLCDSCTIDNVGIRIARKDANVFAAVRLATLAPTDSEYSPHYQSTACVVQRVNVTWDGSAGQPDYSFAIDSKANDNNNEAHEFLRCRSVCSNIAHYWQHGTQIHQIKYYRCQALNYSPKSARFGWFFERGTSVTAELCSVGGDPRSIGGTLFEADFFLGGPGIGFTLRNHNSETSRAIFRTDGQGAPFPVVVEGGRFDLLPDQGKPILYYFGMGPLCVRNNVIISGNEVPPLIQIHTGHSATAYSPGALTVADNVFSCQSSVDRGEPNIQVPANWQIDTSRNVSQFVRPNEWKFRYSRTRLMYIDNN